MTDAGILLSQHNVLAEHAVEGSEGKPLQGSYGEIWMHDNYAFELRVELQGKCLKHLLELQEVLVVAAYAIEEYQVVAKFDLLQHLLHRPQEVQVEGAQ